MPNQTNPKKYSCLQVIPKKIQNSQNLTSYSLIEQGQKQTICIHLMQDHASNSTYIQFQTLKISRLNRTIYQQSLTIFSIHQTIYQQNPSNTKQKY